MRDYVYAKQIPAEFQSCDLDFLDEGGIYEAVIMTGNDRMNSHNTDLLDKVIECAEEIVSELEEGEDVFLYCLKQCEDKDFVDYLNKYYTTEKHSAWKFDEVTQTADAYMKALDGMYNGYRATDKSPDERRAEMLSIFTGEEYATTTIKGYCQGDWQTVYYPKEQYDDQDIEDLEILCFNKGSEWIVHDETEPPETPEDINGYSIYVLRDPRKEIAAAEGVTPDKVVLYECERVMRTVYHESSDNPKAKIAVERD